MGLKEFKYAIKYVSLIIYAVIYTFLVKLVIGNKYILNMNIEAMNMSKRINATTITEC